MSIQAKSGLPASMLERALLSAIRPAALKGISSSAKPPANAPARTTGRSAVARIRTTMPIVAGLIAAARTSGAIWTSRSVTSPDPPAERGYSSSGAS